KSPYVGKFNISNIMAAIIAVWSKGTPMQDIIEAYGHAKSLLFSQLGEDLSKEKYVVLNNDDDFSEYLASVTPYEIFSYGIDNDAQFMAKNIKESLQGVDFDFDTPFGTYRVKSPYVGKFNISNIMAAIIAVWSKGTPMQDIIE
ncbi:hypothetical protein EDM29_15215, partial [Staphylococcus aureus]